MRPSSMKPNSWWTLWQLSTWQSSKSSRSSTTFRASLRPRKRSTRNTTLKQPHSTPKTYSKPSPPRPRTGLTRPAAKEMPTDEISMLFGVAMQAGVETIPSILRVFAQTKLDQVVGPDRVPSFSDISSLPYINGIVNECCRWQAVVALGVPHCTTRNDEYGGYRVPKDTTDLYNNPRDFLPERRVENPDLPNSAAFGYGRRVWSVHQYCPSVMGV
ncbi:cytochrome P450 [Penicillium canescens]|nr:cytochrome P450 [Penicillium canescens]